MNRVAMFVILGALLAGPLILAPLEENLDLFCLVLGAIALTVARCWEWKLVSHALIAATPITLVVIAAGLLFGRFRHQLDDLFATMRRLLPRPAMVASSLIILALLSSVITAVVAALMLAEAVGLMGLAPPERTKVAVLGSFAIGLGAALTPLGEPLPAQDCGSTSWGFLACSLGGSCRRLQAYARWQATKHAAPIAWAPASCEAARDQPNPFAKD